MTDVPAIVTSALSERATARTPDAHGSVPLTRVSEGDLRVIESLAHRPADRRIGLVRRVDPVGEFAEVLLVHAAPELATDRDVVLPSDVTSAPYDAVVQTDLRGAVWILQLGKRFGRLAAPALAAVMAADDIPEANDTFTIRLVDTAPAPPAGVVLSVDGAQAIGTIRNDDGDVRFADSHLRNAVLSALNKPPDGDFTVEELATVRELNASGTDTDEVDDLTGLEAATGLRTLLLFDNAVADLAPLGHLGDLKELYLDRNGFETLDALAPLKGLTTLSLTGNRIEDFSPLEGLTALNRLWLDETGMLDLAPLAGLTALALLDLQCTDRNDFEGRTDCESRSITDVSPLAGLTNLTNLDLNFNNVVDISPLAGLTRLNYLDLWGNEIEDLEPLRGLGDLYWMDLDDNEISDIAPLAGLTGLNALHLNGNRVHDLAP